MIAHYSFRFLLTLVLLGFTAPLTASATPCTFEDGMCGWTLSGGANRQNVDVLGGEYAIFGRDSGPWASQMFMELDITNISGITLEQRWLTEPNPWLNLVHVYLYTIDDEGNYHYQRGSDGVSLLDPDGAPLDTDLRYFDLSQYSGQVKLIIEWHAVVCSPFAPCRNSGNIMGWIDNVEFQTVPEPSTAALIGMGLIGLAIRRQS